VQIGVPTEGDGNADVAPGEQRGGHGEGVERQFGLHAQLVGKGKGGEQLLIRAEVEPCADCGALCASDAALELPVARGGEQAVDGKAVGVEAHGGDLRIQQRFAPGRAVGARGEPVGPGVKQRDPEARAAAAVGGEPSALAEQLVAAMPQRIADHPRLRSEARAEAGGVRDEDDAAQSLDPFVDHFVKGHARQDRVLDRCSRTRH
jgi:hypothetical protein